MASKKVAKKKPANTRASVVKRVYKLGFKEGLNERQKLVNTLRITNHNLWQELTRLDTNEPTEGIWISISFAEELVTALQRSKRNKFYVEELRRRIRKSNLKLKKLVKILDGCKEFK